MKIMIAGFLQETNSFSPVICTRKFFNVFPSGKGEEILANNKNMPTAICGMLDVINKHGDEAIPVIDLIANSSGLVSRDVADEFIDNIIESYKAYKPEVILLSLHGATQLTDHEDGCGFILEEIRKAVGDSTIIAASTDLHANVTKKMLNNANIITGYQTYPHEDYFSTGARAAKLAYKLLNNEKITQACIRVPMIVPAESYDTINGDFAKLIAEVRQCLAERRILDFSIYMMQPWLNVSDAGSSVLITAEDEETAAEYARYFSKKLFAIRKKLTIKLWSVDEIIDIAHANKDDMPVILVDSADSPNAGSAGDSSFVLRKLIERKCTLKTAICINDIPAVDKAFAIGVGGEGEFTLGATMDSIFQSPFTVHAYVKSLHDGNYILEGPAGRGKKQHAGKTAVLQAGNIDIVVFTRMAFSSDPQIYRAFGIEPSLYRLVMVKSATQYKTPYSKFSTLFYPADTPGASSANLTALPFDKLPRPFWPFDDYETFCEDVITSRVWPGIIS